LCEEFVAQVLLEFVELDGSEIKRLFIAAAFEEEEDGRNEHVSG
jgi:hypothetical protein